METKLPTNKGKMGIKDIVRWVLVGAFGLLILFTVIMAAYRKFGGQERIHGELRLGIPRRHQAGNDRKIRPWKRGRLTQETQNFGPKYVC